MNWILGSTFIVDMNQVNFRVSSAPRPPVDWHFIQQWERKGWEEGKWTREQGVGKEKGRSRGMLGNGHLAERRFRRRLWGEE